MAATSWASSSFRPRLERCSQGGEYLVISPGIFSRHDHSQGDECCLTTYSARLLKWTCHKRAILGHKPRVPLAGCERWPCRTRCQVCSSGRDAEKRSADCSDGDLEL